VHPEAVGEALAEEEEEEEAADEAEDVVDEVLGEEVVEGEDHLAEDLVVEVAAVVASLLAVEEEAEAGFEATGVMVNTYYIHIIIGIDKDRHPHRGSNFGIGYNILL
jgi:hypothetical protein